MGTYSHHHPAGMHVLPVFRVVPGDVDTGQPGRTDYATLIPGLLPQLAKPVRIHHVHRPLNHQAFTWADQDSLTPGPGSMTVVSQQGIDMVGIYVALQQPLTVPIKIGSGAVGANPGSVTPDMRQNTRLVCFPSGERPADVTQVRVGGAVQGSGSAQSGAATVPRAVVDELVFGDTPFGEASQYGADAQGAEMILLDDLLPGDFDIRVAPKALRTAFGRLPTNADVLSWLPDDAGLLRIGGEVVGYVDRDPSTGEITIADNGRGMLGTSEQAHERGEPVSFLSYKTVGELTGSVTADSPLFPLEDLDEFPQEGTARIGDELIHWTRLRRGLLEMPTRSVEPGLRDGAGGGIYRGRYGTDPDAHVAGELVILHPFRYWDRWAERADGPELSYLGLHADEPDAYWRRCFWVVEEAPHAGPRIGVLQRDGRHVPWDGAPGETEGLTLFEEGKLDDGGNWIGTQSGAMEWRVFLTYESGAFDPFDGLQHGWKSAPVLQMFGAEFFAPGRTLRRIEK